MYFSHSPPCLFMFSNVFSHFKAQHPKRWMGRVPTLQPAPGLNWNEPLVSTCNSAAPAGAPPWRPFRKFVSIWHPCPAVSGFWYRCTFCGPGLVTGARGYPTNHLVGLVGPYNHGPMCKWGFETILFPKCLPVIPAEVRLLVLGMFWRVPFPAFDIGGVWMSRVSRKWVEIMLRKLRFAYLFGGW